MTKKRKRPHPRLFGRHPLTLGALSLFALSGYELWIRMEDFMAWISGIRHLSSVRGTPFWQDLGIIFEAPEMRRLGFTLLFLSLVCSFALFCLLLRRGARSAWGLMAVGLVVAGAGAFLGLYSLRPSGWMETAKLIPLALILTGCVSNIVQGAIIGRWPSGPKQ